MNGHLFDIIIVASTKKKVIHHQVPKNAGNPSRLKLIIETRAKTELLKCEIESNRAKENYGIRNS